MRSDAEEVDESDAAVVSAGAQGAQLLGSIHVDCGHVWSASVSHEEDMQSA